MPIEASFSWLLLHRVFIENNSSLSFDQWFQTRLPRNGDQLLLASAIQVIVNDSMDQERSTSFWALMSIRRSKRSVLDDEILIRQSCESLLKS